MGMMQEFREFAVKGNMMDMAVGIIIGGAFGKVVSSLVGDLLMPPIGMLVGGVDFTNLAITLKAAAGDQPAVLFGYGRFLQHVFDFLIVAWAMFMVIKGMNVLKREKAAEPPPPPGPTKEETLLTEIRDALRSRS